MNKRKWNIISKKPYKLLIAVLVIASLMGMSYGAFTDQITIGGTISIKPPNRPAPPIDHKITGDIMITPDYWVQAGGKLCHHKETGMPCPGRPQCIYYEYGKGIIFRYPIQSVSQEIGMKITSINGQCRFELRVKGQSEPIQVFKATIGDIDSQIIKEGDTYLQAKSAIGQTLTPGTEYVIESNIHNFNTALNGDSEGHAVQLNEEFRKYYPNQLNQLEVVANLNFKIGYKTLGGQTGIIEDSMEQILSVGTVYTRDEGPTTQFMTTPPALTIVPPTHTLPPDITLPEVTTNPQLDIMLLPELYEDNPSGE